MAPNSSKKSFITRAKKRIAERISKSEANYFNELDSDYFNDLRIWFYKILKQQMRYSQEGWGPFGNYYEFGVGWGGTLSAYLSALSSFCKKFDLQISNFPIFGFDSFEGLPISNEPADQRIMQKQKAFHHELEEVKENLKKDGFILDNFNIRFIKGEFSKLLTSSLRDELKKHPPSIVTIDVDYYSSTKVVLEWLYPILKSGTMFYFDDVWSFHGNPNYGELKAINEFNKSFDCYLTPFPLFGMPGRSYIYSKKEFEYSEK